MAGIDAIRDIVFVHGIQWKNNKLLVGYSLKTQKLIKKQAPSVNFRFHEVLWSDIVEEDQRKILNGAGLISDIATGNILSNLLTYIQLIGKKTDFNIESSSEAFETKIPDLLKSKKSKHLKNALSAVMDLAFYFSDKYGTLVREKVIETINNASTETAPVLFGHSLGSVILADIIRKESDSIKVGGFVTAGSPLGLFQPDMDHDIFSRFDWINFYDTDDIVCFWNPLKKKGYKNVIDQKIDVHELPVYSHIKYWTNSVIARELADMALTL